MADTALELAPRLTDLYLDPAQTELELEDHETEVDHPREMELAIDG